MPRDPSLLPLYVRSYGVQTGAPGSMPPGLLDPDLKRQWAHKHLKEFESRCRLLQDTHSPKISTEDDLQGGFYVVKTEHAPFDARLIELALFAGDFASNLRSALDHLAWQLVMLNGQKPSPNTCFPVCESDNSHSRRYFTRCTADMNEDAISILEAMQPYHAGKDFRSTVLWRLNKLWNIDKHRHFFPHAVISEWQFRMDGVRPVGTRQIDNCTFVRFRLSDKPAVHLNPNVTVEFRLRDSTENIDLGLSDLTSMYEFVANEALPAFAGLFPKI